MAYFKPLPKPERLTKKPTRLARADGVIKPFSYIMFSPEEWVNPLCEHVVAFNGGDFRRIMGLYICKVDQRRDGSEPPMDAVRGDIIHYVEICYDD